MDWPSKLSIRSSRYRSVFTCTLRCRAAQHGAHARDLLGGALAIGLSQHEHDLAAMDGYEVARPRVRDVTAYPLEMAVWRGLFRTHADGHRAVSRTVVAPDLA